MWLLRCSLYSIKLEPRSCVGLLEDVSSSWMRPGRLLRLPLGSSVGPCRDVSRRPHSTYCSCCVEELNQSPQDVPLLLFLTSQVRSRGQVCFFLMTGWNVCFSSDAAEMRQRPLSRVFPLNPTRANLWDSEVTGIRMKNKERLIASFQWRIRKYSATYFMTRVTFWDAPVESM